MGAVHTNIQGLPDVSAGLLNFPGGPPAQDREDGEEAGDDDADKAGSLHRFALRLAPVHRHQGPDEREAVCCITSPLHCEYTYMPGNTE